MPEEHGAWGILLVPFFCSAAVAGRWNIPLVLAGMCTLSLFLLRGSLYRRAPGMGRSETSASLAHWRPLLTPSHLLLAAVGCATGGILLFVYGRFQLVWLGAAAAGLFWLQSWLIGTHQQRQAEKRSLFAELVGVALLTLTAPAAWIASRGSLLNHERMTGWGSTVGLGVEVWLLNLLFFLGGILYVKYRVRGVLAHRRFGSVRERLAFAWPVFLYHALLAAFLAGWVVFDTRYGAGHSPTLHSALLGLAFVPGILRVCRLLFEIGEKFPIRRLGWTEIAHSVVFGSLLILGMRLAE